jgi:MFS family permease
MGILVLILLLPLNLLLRQRPQDIGLEPDGDSAEYSASRIGHTSNVVDPAWVAVDWTLGRAMRTSRFWWIAVGYFCALFAWYAVQVHQTQYLMEIGFSPALAAWALGMVSLAGIPGQIGLGYLSDRIGREFVWTVGSLGFTATFLLLLLLRDSPTPVLLYAMVAAQGVLGYGVTSVIGAIPAEIFQGRHYGTILGTLMLASIGGGGAGPWVTGALHDATGSYALAFWIGIGCSVLSAVAIWFAAPRKVRMVAGRMARHA